MLSKYYGIAVIGFFLDCYESVKPLRQLVYLVINAFDYIEAWHLVIAKLRGKIFLVHFSLVNRSNYQKSN